MKPLLARAFAYVILAVSMLSTIAWLTDSLVPHAAMAAQADDAARNTIRNAPQDAPRESGDATWGTGTQPARQLPRHDTIMGTGGDQSYIGRDPDTGDRIMESQGPPPHQDMPGQQPPLIIVPEISVNATGGAWGTGSQPGGVMRPTPLPRSKPGHTTGQ